MAEHSLDGQVGLAGIGRPEDGRDALRSCRHGGLVHAISYGDDSTGFKFSFR
jgi:ribosomal protein L25 (general stress protein Ctc)